MKCKYCGVETQFDAVICAECARKRKEDVDSALQTHIFGLRLTKKQLIRTIVGIALFVVGVIFYIVAQSEVLTSTRYTFSRPYTNYELSVLAIRTIGLLSVIGGVICVVSCTRVHTMIMNILKKYGNSIH